MTEQVRLAFPSSYLAEERWPELLEIVKQEADRIGRKQVAYDLDVSRTVLDNTLADRDRCHLKARHLVYFALQSPRIAEWFARLSGGTFEPNPVMTPEEELAALKKVLRDQGEVGRHLLGLVKGGTR
jgi:hypothetical protein